MSHSHNGSSGLARCVALALVICTALGSLGWLGWSCIRKPEVYFLPRLAPAEWVIYPSGPKSSVNARVEMGTLFRRSFTLERVSRTAVLSIAGLRHYALSINGEPAATPAKRGRNWKQPDQFDVSQQLRAGENQIAVTVWNSNGPPVLWLSLDAGGWLLNSDARWEASYEGAAWRQARLASKPKVALAGSLIRGGEEPWASPRARWLILLLFAVLSGAVYWLLNRRSALPSEDSPRTTQHGTRLGFLAPDAIGRELVPVLALSVLWIALFTNNLGVLPNLVGYDVDGHLAYIQYIQQHHCLPRADQGWEMFQPPLYYLLGATLLSALSLSVTQDGGVMALRVMGMAIGIAHFVLVWASLRLLFPDERSKQRWGLLLAAALPPLLYLSQYVSNEGLAAALVSACLFLTLRMLKQERSSMNLCGMVGTRSTASALIRDVGDAVERVPTKFRGAMCESLRGIYSWKACAGLGLCLGAALLTKATGLLVVPVVVGALLWKSWLTPRAGTPRFALPIAQLGLALAICAAVCGWHYERLWAQYGTPLIGVWDPRLGFSWWQDDGYRTSAFYLRFGSVLAHPWFSSFQSFGDGIYATLWGDGLLGGKADALARPPWNYDLMAVGYWLALVPTLAVLIGGILALVTFLRQPSAEWFLLLGLAFLSALALLHLSIVLPYQCHVKAFYALCALVPLCAFGARGFDALCRWGGGLRPLLCIVGGLWGINSYAALWVSRSSEATVLSRTQSLDREERQPEALNFLRTSLERETNPGAEAQALLAHLLTGTGDSVEASKLAETAVRRGPNEPRAHMVLADILEQQHLFEQAIEHARRAVQLAPGNDVAYEQLASLLLRDGHADEAVRIARDGLAVAPFSAELRCALGAALVARGENVEGISQLQLACAIKPGWAASRLMLAATLANQGKLSEATHQLREALRLEPANATAHSQLASTLAAQHQLAEAIAEYAEALRLEPDFAAGLNNLAWIRAANPQSEFRNGPEAVRLAERACEATKYNEPMMVGTLAAAYAEAGRFDEATATARKARELALAAGQHELADKNQKLIELFSARQPYHEPGQPAPQ